MALSSYFYLCLLTFYLAVGMLTGCGYQFRVHGPGPTIGGTSEAQAKAQANAPTMSIPNFDNKSFEPNLELKYTNYARHEFAAGSGARIVTGSEPSDLVFKGQIVTVIVPTLAFTIEPISQTLESRVTVMVRASVEDVRAKKVIWNQLVTASSEYFLTNDLQFNRILQDRALEQAGQLIVQDLAARFQSHLDTYGMGVAPDTAPVPRLPTPPGRR